MHECLENDSNKAKAEAELAKLSDDLQRALHRQCALELRVQEDEEKIIIRTEIAVVKLLAEGFSCVYRTLGNLRSDPCSIEPICLGVR